MRLTIFFIFLILLLEGCKEESKKYADLKNNSFSGLVLPLPSKYVETSVDSLIEIWRYSDLPLQIVERKIKYFESLKLKLKSDFIIFADTSDISNTVLIFNGPFIKFSKWTSKEFYLMLDKKLRAEANELGVGFVPIENSYHSLTNGHSFMKVKFEWNSDGLITYGTQYVLNTRGGTYGILVINKEDDFEEMIRRARLLSK